MKKYLTPCLAVIAVVAIVLCIVFAGQRGVKQTDVDAQIAKAVEEAKTAAAAEKDEAVKAATDAADAAKAEADAKIADLTKQLEEAPKAEDIQAQVTAAAEAAKTEAQTAAETELQGKVDEAVKAATEAAETEKAELTKQLEEAKAAVETVKAEMQTKLDEAAKGADEAAKTALETAEKEKADLQAKLEAAVKEKDEAVAAAKAEAEAKIAELTKQAEGAAAAVTTAVTEAVDTAKETAAEPAAEEKTEEKAEEKTEEKTEEPAAAAPAVMTYAEFMAADVDSEVCVETFVQAKQAWWDNKLSIYAVTPGDGGYFIYNANVTEEEAAKLVPGTNIRVKGIKSIWPEVVGEIEITEATVEILDSGVAFEANAQDVTDLLGTDALKARMNDFVLFKGMTVDSFTYKDEAGKTDDIYLKLSKDGKTYDFCVEFYLTGKDSETYKAVEALNAGDVIDVEAFLYWYNDMNPHVVKVTKAQ